MSNLKKLVIVDDEYDIGLVVKDFFTDYGFLSWIAIDTTSGLALIEKEKPEIIFLDLIIPQIGGIECLKQIRKVSPESYVIMMTGIQDQEIAKQALKEGAYDYVTKPFDLGYIKINFIDRIFPPD